MAGGWVAGWLGSWWLGLEKVDGSVELWGSSK
jgi:hypothetical protein